MEFVFPDFPGDHLAPEEQSEYIEWTRQFDIWRKQCWAIRNELFAAYQRSKNLITWEQWDRLDFYITCTGKYQVEWDRKEWVPKRVTHAKHRNQRIGS